MLAMKEKGDKWAKIMNANADKLDAVKLYKKSHKGNYFSKTVTGKDWKSDAGYECRVVSSAEREQQGLKTIQKPNAVKAQFPGNMAMAKIYGKKILEFADLNPDEIKEVMDQEEQNMKSGGGLPASPETAPQVPQLTQPQNALQLA